MTKTQELLAEAAEKLGGVTDYKLAQRLGIPRQTLTHYRSGKRQADAYVAAQLALVLGRDPLAVIAEVEAESARSKPARDFWARFPSGLRRTALGVALSAICGTSALEARIGYPDTASHNGRLRQRPRPTRTAPRGGFFVPTI